MGFCATCLRTYVCSSLVNKMEWICVHWDGELENMVVSSRVEPRRSYISIMLKVARIAWKVIWLFFSFSVKLFCSFFPKENCFCRTFFPAQKLKFFFPFAVWTKFWRRKTEHFLIQGHFWFVCFFCFMFANKASQLSTQKSKTLRNQTQNIMSRLV